MDIRRAMIGLAVVGVFALVILHQFVFFSHVVDLTVMRNDAPSYCSTAHRDNWYLRERGRSSVPQDPRGYCGSIRTTMGNYKLPDSKYFLSLHQSRPYLDETLVEGCRFRVLVVGYGKKFAKGDKPRTPIRQKISRVVEELGCSGNRIGGPAPGVRLPARASAG
ncbi:hypothetical protein ILP92_17320 [Maribius pontilimi]|uniref:Uncharacterized protein n=1 Tax=Palleronia pontilimi TaxID=1964209 RepID=A0A934IC95_9RHOB|nr:hypothetical protein [Palleronia pontilimi]MBJ3764499.1 hypothetical protein [Palleronia pontilimi]